jgi:WD40 repeat protein
MSFYFAQPVRRCRWAVARRGGAAEAQPRSAAGAGRARGIACLVGLVLAGAAAGQPREVWKDQPNEVRALAVSPDGKTLASLSLFARDGDGITLWDLATGKKTATFGSPRTRGFDLAFTPDGKSLVAIVSAQTAKGEDHKYYALLSAEVWDLSTQKVRRTIAFPDRGAFGLVLTPDGKTLLAGGPKAGVVPYDLETGKASDPLDLGKDYQDVRRLALSPDGKTLAVGTESNVIVLWDMEKKAVRATVPVEKGRFGESRLVESLAFSPDGKTVGSANILKGADLWDAGNGKSAGKIVVDEWVCTVQLLVFSPDGKTIAVCGERKGVTLWDVAAGGERDDFEGDVQTGGVLSAVFTPDGKTLITCGCNKDIWLWDVPQGKPKGIKPKN